MAAKCTLHPTRSAQWTCSACDIMICRECVVENDKGGIHSGEKIHLCPKCNYPVEWLGAQSIVAPFWTRMHQFFLYPFSLQPLVLMIILSVAGGMVSGAGLVKWLLRGVIGLVMLKYSFEALRTTAGGKLKAPAISAESISNDLQQVFKQFAIYIAIFLMVAFSFPVLGRGLSILLLYFLTFLAPAMIILLVTTESLLHALNPALFIRLAFRIGWGYVVMYLFLALLGSAPAVLGYFIIARLPTGLQTPIIIFAQCYYTIISYHLMGYVLLQYSDQIGYHVEFEDFDDPSLEKANKKSDDPEEAVLNQVNTSIRNGDLDAAVSMIETLKSNGGIVGLPLSERYFQLLKMKGDKQAMLDHATAYLGLLAEKGSRKKGLEVYGICKEADSEFLPSPSTLFKVGMWQNDAGKAKEAIMTLQSVVKKYPDASEVPDAYFRAAQIFNDRLMNPEKAKKILNGIIKKYPDHETTKKARNYLGTLA